jgi:hypothetical protein
VDLESKPYTCTAPLASNSLYAPPFQHHTDDHPQSPTHFCPREQPDRLDDVIITHNGRLCLTGRMYSGLYFLDEHPSAAATLTAAPPSVQQLTRAWECHRRSGRLGFNNLAGLSRKGMLADETQPLSSCRPVKNSCASHAWWESCGAPPTRPGFQGQCVCYIGYIWTSVTCRMVGTSER